MPRVVPSVGRDDAASDYDAELPPPPKQVVVAVADQRPDVDSTDGPAPRLPVVPGYDIVEEVGRGGMGVVYKAWQSGLKRLVALKMMHAGPAVAGEQIRRLRAEAEVVARFAHPNLVQIHEVGAVDGLPFLAMEYVDGGSLAQRLDGTPQPAALAGAFVETLARAMHYAHQRGVIHRDLKPANILLSVVSGPLSVAAADRPSLLTTDNGQLTAVPKITDFGLAKQLDGGADPTCTGLVMGTPSYMSPEQAAGRSKDVGPTSDVYALGAILYELLTGRPPFRAASAMETVRQVLAEEPVAPARLQPAVPRDLQTICLKCLEKDCARRYAGADLLADDLRRVQEGRPILARPVGRLERTWRWARRNPRVAGLLSALVLVFVAGFLGILWQWRKAEGLRLVAQEQRDEARRSLRELTSLVHFIENDQLYYLNYVKLRKEAWEAMATQAQEFLAEHADDGERAVDVARAHYRLAYFRQRSAGPAAALPHALRALELHTALVDRSPDAVPLQRDLAAVYLLVGWLRHVDKHSDEALTYLRPCLELRRKILASDPNNLDFHSELAGTLNNLGLALSTLGKAGQPALLEEGAAQQREAIEHSEQACAKSPGIARYKILLSHHYFNLAMVYCDLHRPAAAAKAVARCQELWPRDPDQHLRAARILSRASECKGQGALSPNERAQFLIRAVAALRRAVECGFDNHALLVGFSGDDLCALRDLPEFRELAAQVEERAKVAQK